MPTNTNKVHDTDSYFADALKPYPARSDKVSISIAR